MPILDLPGDLHLGYRDDGTDATPPLLLLRPVGGSSALWGPFHADLARERRVIAIDHRGSGGSSPARIGITTRTLMKDALAVLDALKVDVADVFGVSLGGMIATRLAADAPDRVRRLILASTPVRGIDVEAFHARDATIKGLTLARCLARPSADLLPCLVAELLSPNFRERHPDEARRVIDAARAERPTRRGLTALIAAALRHDASRDLHKIRAKTLLLVGEHDPLLTVASQKRLYRQIADCELDLVHDTGHAMTMEQPHACATRVLEFLR